MPFYQVITIFTGEKTHKCFYYPNLFFFQSMYLLLFGLLLLKLTLRNKRKVKILLLTLLFSIILRGVYSFLYLYKFSDEYIIHDNSNNTKNSNNILNSTSTIIDNFNHVAFSARFDNLAPVFFYYFPNLIFGILCGYIYYLDCNFEHILTDKKSQSLFEGINSLRSFFSHYIVRNILFILSLAGIVALGWFNEELLRNISTIQSMFEKVLLYSVHSVTLGVLISFIYSLSILTVKLKGTGVLRINQIIMIVLKKFLSSQFLLLWGRSIFVINVLAVVTTYYFVLNMDVSNFKDFIIFFNIIILNGFTIIIVVFVISLVITVIFEVPIRVLMKNKLDKNY